MFGNCATGRVAMVTAPTITIRMAITIATMGRLMKKFDMDSDSSQSKYFYFAFWLIDPTARLVSSRSKELGESGLRRSASQATRSSFLLRRSCQTSLGHKWFGFYGHVSAEGLLTLCNHTITGF